MEKVKEGKVKCEINSIIGSVMRRIPVFLCSVKGGKDAGARGIKLERNWGNEPGGGTKKQDSTTDVVWGFGEHIWTYKKVPAALPSLSSDGIGWRRKRDGKHLGLFCFGGGFFFFN